LHSQCSIIHTDLKPENFLLAPLVPYKVDDVQKMRKQITEEREKEEKETQRKKQEDDEKKKQDDEKRKKMEKLFKQHKQ